MAFGTSSKIFTSFITDMVTNTAPFQIRTASTPDTIKLALFGNSGTPDQTVASAATAFNTGQWTTGNEVTATGWTSGGLALTITTSGFSSATYTLDANDRSGGATDTVTAAYGCLIYDDTLTTPVADQGICYLAFGGSNSVTSGTFTVSFNTAGILTIAV